MFINNAGREQAQKQRSKESGRTHGVPHQSVASAITRMEEDENTLLAFMAPIHPLPFDPEFKQSFFYFEVPALNCHCNYQSYTRDFFIKHLIASGEGIIVISIIYLEIVLINKML